MTSRRLRTTEHVVVTRQFVDDLELLRRAAVERADGVTRTYYRSCRKLYELETRARRNFWIAVAAASLAALLLVVAVVVRVTCQCP